MKKTLLYGVRPLQFKQMLKFINRRGEKRHTLMVGSLHSSIASYIPDFLQIPPKHLDQACFLKMFSTSAKYSFSPGHRLTTFT